MRTTYPAIAATTVALLALSACGDAEEAEVEEPAAEQQDQPQEPTEEHEGDDGYVEAGGVPDETVWVGEGDMPEHYEGIGNDPVLQDRTFTGRMGEDVDAAVGEPVEVDFGAFENHGDYVGTVTLESVQATPYCEGETGEEYPVNEHFIAVTFTLEADEQAEENLDISGGDFRWEGFDDYVGGGYEAYSCESAYNGLMDSVRPGESAERTLFFDVPELEGTLSWRAPVFDVNWNLTTEDYTGNLPPEYQ